MIVTLTTDFGLTDHYVGAMKGVILGICPKAQIVDITHGVTPYEIAEGAYTIAQAWRYFPRKTVHVVVVDPGVGSARRPVVVEAGGSYFVGPDNGVFSLLYAAERCKVRHLGNTRYFLPNVSRTFHGRDIFAPVAAHLAAGVPPARFGRIVRDWVQADFAQPQPAGPGKWTARILKIDHFGNIITNILAADFPALTSGKFRLAINGRRVGTFARSHAEAKKGELIVIEGSSGYYEISRNQGSAAKAFNCRADMLIRLEVE